MLYEPNKNTQHEIYRIQRVGNNFFPPTKQTPTSKKNGHISKYYILLAESKPPPMLLSPAEVNVFLVYHV